LQRVLISKQLDLPAMLSAVRRMMASEKMPRSTRSALRASAWGNADPRTPLGALQASLHVPERGDKGKILLKHANHEIGGRSRLTVLVWNLHHHRTLGYLTLC
jgi:hypothetical protein